jgi:hypothetical protein
LITIPGLNCHFPLIPLIQFSSSASKWQLGGDDVHLVGFFAFFLMSDLSPPPQKKQQSQALW